MLKTPKAAHKAARKPVWSIDMFADMAEQRRILNTFKHFLTETLLNTFKTRFKHF